MGYKIGDKVVLRDDLEVGETYGVFTFFESMVDIKGRTFTIIDEFGNYEIDIKFWVTDEMIDHEKTAELKKGEVKMKGKEWLLEKLGILNERFPYSNAIRKDDVLELVNKLDKPELPVIPEFVAEWIEEWKNTLSLTGVFTIFRNRHDERYNRKVADWLYSYDEKGYVTNNDEIFAIACIYGYTVKKDKYVVKSDIGTYFILDTNNRKWDYTGIPEDKDSIKYATKFTSKEKAESVALLFGGSVKEVTE